MNSKISSGLPNIINILKIEPILISLEAILTELYKSMFFYDKRFTQFVAVSRGRTGSTLLRNLLRHHGSVKMYGEVFGTPPPFITTDHFICHDYDNPEDYLKEFVFSKKNLRKNRAVGFTFHYGHKFRFPNFADWIKGSKVKIIHLIRRNFLDVILSNKLAKEHGSAWSNVIFTKPVSIDHYYLYTAMKTYEQEIQEYEKILPKTRYLVYYSDLLTRDKQIELLKYLGLPTKRMFATIVKQRQKSQSEMLTNYWQLKKKFEGTKYYQFFED